DETSHSTWQHYSYTLTATTPVYAPGDVFHELRLGLLDAGVVLLDNISVVESPGGTAHELMQNSTFTSGAATWRFYGNHSHSTVVTDPDNAANKVLRLVATGRSSYLDDRIESTLKFAGTITPVVAGRQYRISFDAKWLAGSPQVHTELYYNKVAKTIIVAQPYHHGTPGLRNSTYVPNLGPTYSGLRHTPVIPQAGEPVTVSINASDPNGIAAMTLWYSPNAGPWQSAAMSPSTNNLFTGVIPGQAGGAVIQFYVEGRDSLSVTSTYPRGGRGSRALIKVNDGLSQNNRQSLRLILTQADTDKMLALTNLMSTDLLGATIVANNKEVFYDAGVRLHGSMFTRTSPSTTGFSVHFPADHLFRGIHSSIALKRAGNLENLVHLMSNRAGGIPGMMNDYVYLISHVPGNIGPAKLYLASYDNTYLDSQFEDGSDGTLFKMEGIRDYLLNAGPEEYKLPSPVGWVGNYDISDLGDDKEQYRWSTLIENNTDHDDYSHYIAMAKVFNLNGAALQQAAPNVMDVDEWMRTFAMMSLCGISDAYTQGNPHNIDFYSRPGDGKMLAFPWDWDFTFVRGTTAPLWGDENLSKIISLPANTRLFHGHLRDIIQRSFNQSYMARWITHYTQQSGENYAPYLSYIRDRGNYVLSQLPAPIPFEITSNGGNDFSVSNTTVTLQGRGWIDVGEIRLSGDDSPLAVTWLDAQRWQVTLPVNYGPNPLGFGAYDRQGRLLACDSVVVASTVSGRPQQDFLRVTEINYHPYPPTANELTAGFIDADEFEFIELMNLGPVTLDLTGARFITGITFSFANGASLGSGQRLILARNRGAIAKRYGTNVLVHGLYTGKLDNAGEQLVLIDQSGAVILDFTYNDHGDWPAGADGTGSTLEILDPSGNYNDPFNWQASPETGGTPGYGSENRPIHVSILQDGGLIKLRFNASMGRSHTVLFQDQLDQGEWLPLTPVPSALRERLIELNVEGVTQRFFRVSRDKQIP
ncbi:MAG TPA: CotH kinase family protein, partial [Verrucomicrobiae bacterium]